MLKKIKSYNACIIYVKGIEKYKFLQQLLYNKETDVPSIWEDTWKIREIQSVFSNVPSLRDLKREFSGIAQLNGGCYYHSADGCALLNLRNLIHWYLTNVCN